MEQTPADQRQKRAAPCQGLQHILEMFGSWFSMGIVLAGDDSPDSSSSPMVDNGGDLAESSLAIFAGDLEIANWRSRSTC